jgi:amidophosphoribosyltransferase
MSDEIKHECGLAYIRLRKPLSYYLQKRGSVTYGLNKLYLLMEKQHNRGQDGAGLATLKLNIEPGNPFLYRLRSNAQQPIADLFYKIGLEIQELEKFQPDIAKHPGLMNLLWVKFYWVIYATEHKEKIILIFAILLSSAI